MKRKTKVHLLLSGQVQGVFFRASTKAKARNLKISGWVKNLPDGKVEIVAEGEKEKLEELINWARKGPITAKVEDIEIEWQEYIKKFDSFEVCR